MKLYFHLLKKELRQHRWLLSLIAVLLLIKLAGQTLPHFNQLTSTYFYEVMAALETATFSCIMGTCGYIGYCSGPMQRDGFLATRPIPVIPMMAAKLSIPLLLTLLIYAKECITAYQWGMSTEGLIYYYLPGFLMGSCALLLCSLWPTLRALYIGIVAMFALLLLITLLYGEWGPKRYDIHANAYWLVLSIGSGLVLSLTIKTGKASHPICISCFITICTLAYLISTYTPPRIPKAPEGTIDQAFQASQKKRFWAYGTSPTGQTIRVGSYQHHGLIKTNYVATPLAKSVTIQNDTEILIADNDFWESRREYFYRGNHSPFSIISQTLEADQINYLKKRDSKYRNQANKTQNKTIFAGEFPHELAAEDSLQVTVQLSHQIHTYEQLATFPLKEGTVLTGSGIRVSIVQISEAPKSHYYTVWLLVQEKRKDWFEGFWDKSPSLVITSQGRPETYIEDLRNHTEDSAIGHFYSYLTPIKIYHYNTEAATSSENRQAAFWQWNYLGIEDSPPATRTIQVAKLFRSKKKEPLKTYPLRRTTEATSLTAAN